MEPLDRSIEALKLFKDWSNYLLVTTVAAIGWVSTRLDKGQLGLLQLSLWLLAASAILGVLTLAVIPLIAESLNLDEQKVPTSIHETEVTSYVLNRKLRIYLPQFCRPQHVTFILGVAFYAAAESGMRWDGRALFCFFAGLAAIVAYALFSRPWSGRVTRKVSTSAGPADTGRSST